MERVENKKKNETYVILHFTSGMGNGKTLRIIFRARDARKNKINTAIQLLTMETVETQEYLGGKYEKIK
jgi:hypothetical protein